MTTWMSLCSVVASGLLTLLAVLSALWLTRRRTNIPGPPTLPLLGNTLHFRKLPVVVGRIRDMHRQYGDVFRLYIGWKLSVIVTRAEDVQRVLTVSKGRDTFFTNPYRDVMGDGLISNFGRKWKIHRRAIEPAFRRETVINFITIFNEGADFVCEHLAASVGLEQDLYLPMLQETLRSIMATNFGVSLDEIIPDCMERESFGKKLVYVLKFAQKRIFRPWLFNWTLYITPDGQKFRKMNSFMRDTTKSVVKMNADNINASLAISKMIGENKRGNKFTEGEVLDETCTILLAGSETTAAAICYTLCLLALYPEWQDCAVRELEDVYGQEDDYLRQSTVRDLEKLLVLESIIKETIRLFPLGPAIPHIVKEDVQLDGGRYVVPRDSSVIVAYSLLHRQPDAFPDPDKFDPSRFMEGGTATGRHPYSYLPFGGGPRMCIGARYAMVQMKVVLSAVLRRFRFLPGSTREELEDVVVSITGHPVTGYRLTCVPQRGPVTA